ncbi:hypothetical protein KCU88_g145, partial [Aureobasidium melanogenum]
MFSISLDFLGHLFPFAQLLFGLLHIEPDFEPFVKGVVGLETDPKPIAIARPLTRTEGALARKDLLPQVLEDPAAHGIPDLRPQQPVAEMCIPLARQLPDAVATQGKLRAARLSQDLRDRLEREQLCPGIRHQGLLQLFRIFFDLARMDPFGTTWHPVAPEVHVPFSDDPFVAEPLDHLSRVKVQQVVVVLENVGQINHHFVPFVFRYVQRRIRVVGHIDHLGDLGPKINLVEPFRGVFGDTDTASESTSSVSFSIHGPVLVPSSSAASSWK